MFWNSCFRFTSETQEPQSLAAGDACETWHAEGHTKNGRCEGFKKGSALYPENCSSLLQDPVVVVVVHRSLQDILGFFKPLIFFNLLPQKHKSASGFLFCCYSVWSSFPSNSEVTSQLLVQESGNSSTTHTLTCTRARTHTHTPFPCGNLATGLTGCLVRATNRGLDDVCVCVCVHSQYFTLWVTHTCKLDARQTHSHTHTQVHTHSFLLLHQNISEAESISEKI